MAKFLSLTGLQQFLTKTKEWANSQFALKSRKINGKPLTTDITLTASDVGAVSTAEKLSLGETETTAYRGDRGKDAYTHSQSAHARADATKVEKSTTNGNVIINGSETVVYAHPNLTAKVSGLYKVAVDDKGHVSAAETVNKNDITALGIPGTNTTYSPFKGATAAAAGGTGLVPAPATGGTNKYLRGDGTWAELPDNTIAEISTSEIDALFSA